MPPRHLVIVGATATGKSALALALATRLHELGRQAEIVSVDSMQVYRRMDIGTAKPTAAEQASVRHHLIDLVDPSEDFSVARLQEAARDALGGIEQRGAHALVVGGTGLYVRAVVDGLTLPGHWPAVRAELERALDEPEGLSRLFQELQARDPVAATRMVPTNARRIVRALEVCRGSGRPFSSFGPGLDTYAPAPDYHQIGLRRRRDDRDARLRERYRLQLEAGFLEEVRTLAAGRLSRTAEQALGYRELLAHVRGEVSLGEALELAVGRTRRFASRQERWFRRDPRIVWYDLEQRDKSTDFVDHVLGDWLLCPSRP